MATYVHGACDCDCGFVGQCIVVQLQFDDEAIMCEVCYANHVMPSPDFANDTSDDEDMDGPDYHEDIDWSEYDSSIEDEPPMYGYDHDNPISMGAHDE